MDRSRIERLEPALQDAVDEAIIGGATIDPIVARIRAAGRDFSRSSVRRYVKRMRGPLRLQCKFLADLTANERRRFAHLSV